MRSAQAGLARSSAFVIRATAVLITGSLASLVAMAGTATAEQAARVEPNTVTFGLLGPVGLVAVALGIIGMAAGVLRQRRRARATVPAGTPDNAGNQVTAMTETVFADTSAPRS